MRKIRDLQSIQIDVIASRTQYDEVKTFLADKPLLLGKLEFVIRTLGDKIKAIEGINLSMRNELDLINKEITSFEKMKLKDNVPELIEALGLESVATELIKQFKQTHK